VKPKARLKQQSNSPQQIRQGGDKPLVCLYQQGMHASSNQTLTGEIFAAHGSRLGGYGRTLVMGIVNITPDSFTDGGLFFHPDTAITHARHLVDEGADILDIGGESTRPGAQMVPMEEEWKRVEPVIRALSAVVACPLSIDTYKAEIAARAVAAGASIVNDVWGFQADAGMADVVASLGVSAVLMHNRKEIDPSLDIMEDALRFLEHSLNLASRAGVPSERLAVDPGIGFGKTLDQNLVMIAQLHRLKQFGVPVLLGASRKSMIDKIYPSAPMQRLPGTIATHTIGILAGADIVRAHDVSAAVQAARVTDRLREMQ
jgi:dihydropteroate synthase